MKNRQAEYDMSTGHYLVYDMSSGKVVHAFDLMNFRVILIIITQHL